MNAVYATESVIDLWDEAMPLLEAHYLEIASFKDIPLDPDRELYEALDATNQFRCFTARVDERLVGYAAFFVRPNAHYKGSLQAVQDVLYVDPVHRGRHVGKQLLKFADHELALIGVQVVMHHVKHRHPLLGRLLEIIGYWPAETIYLRRLR